uniref:thiamine phosphate synthase n=1 Tax=Tetradesmus obliquus TaxID=3088 RepID=A0A383VQM6_TETOB|eukprot:jgi/Sobl393_1/14733/SZX67149.1
MRLRAAKAAVSSKQPSPAAPPRQVPQLQMSGLKDMLQQLGLCRPRGIPVIINDRVDVAIAAGADGVHLCRPRGIPVIINDRVDVAIAAGADGVHVGQSDIPARLVRQMIGPDKILGVSVKTPAEAAKAQADGADYIGVGAVFPTGTKASSVIGLSGVAEVCRSASLPAVAIGGVGAHNAKETIAAGVEGLAVVSAVFAAPDVAAATRELRQAVDAAVDAHAEQQQQVEPVAAVVA